MSYVSTPKPMHGGLGVERLCSQETSIKIVKASMSISMVLITKERLSHLTLSHYSLFPRAYSFSSSHAQLICNI